MAYGKSLTPILQLARQAGVSQLTESVGMPAEQAAEPFEWRRGVRPNTKAVIRMRAVPLS